MAVLLGSIALLAFSSLMTIKNVTKVAKASRISETSIGFLLIAFATTIPEFSVTIASLAEDAVGLAVGNLIGSNAANIGLIVGLPFLLVHIRMPRVQEAFPSMSSSEVSAIFFGLLIASIVPLFLIVWSFAVQILGVILIALYFLNSYNLISKRDKQEASAVELLEKGFIGLLKSMSLLFLGIAGVIVSAFFIVDSGVSLAHYLGVSEVVIGAVIVAIGTSLPELSISISAAITKHQGLALGNAVGACFTNITLLFGVLLLFGPGKVVARDFLTQIVFSLLLNLFLWYFLLSRRLGAREAFSLVSLYSLFILANLGLAFKI